MIPRRSGKSRHHCLFLILRGKNSTFYLEYDINCGFGGCPSSVGLRKFFFYFEFVENFFFFLLNHESMSNSVKCLLSASITVMCVLLYLYH